MFGLLIIVLVIASKVKETDENVNKNLTVAFKLQENNHNVVLCQYAPYDSFDR